MNILLVKLPYCPQNDLVAKRFLSKFYQFTNKNFQAIIKWITKKAQKVLSLKDKNPYPEPQIYKWTCVFDETIRNYVGQTIRNVDIRWNEREDIHKEYEPAKHLRENLNYKI